MIKLKGSWSHIHTEFRLENLTERNHLEKLGTGRITLECIFSKRLVRKWTGKKQAHNMGQYPASWTKQYILRFHIIQQVRREFLVLKPYYALQSSFLRANY
jgi:hypothetical protein